MWHTQYKRYRAISMRARGGVKVAAKCQRVNRETSLSRRDDDGGGGVGIHHASIPTRARRWTSSRLWKPDVVRARMYFLLSVFKRGEARVLRAERGERRGKRRCVNHRYAKMRACEHERCGTPQPGVRDMWKRTRVLGSEYVKGENRGKSIHGMMIWWELYEERLRFGRLAMMMMMDERGRSWRRGSDVLYSRGDRF